MDYCLHDYFFQFCLYHYPILLHEEDEVFEKFVQFIHGVAKHAILQERERQANRRGPSWN